jgi:hypothetical protein
VATLSSLVERVRFELGDLPKSFVSQFISDISTNRYRLNYAPVDASGLTVFKNGVDISDTVSVEEQTGIIVLEDLPEVEDEFTVTGNYFRYFTTTELQSIVTTAVAHHSGRDVDSLGRKITLENLPPLEEYPVSLYASTLALYTLATDASFDINVFAPDGVSIPRSERYRQLMEMIDSRKEQYRELCTQLGIGLYSIDVFSLRRISKTTNRYVPVYRPQEVDDRSFPQRAEIPMPTYGSAPTAWPTDAGELTAYQGRAFTHTLTLTGDYADALFSVRLIPQRGSPVLVQNFAFEVTDNEDGTFTIVMSLTADQTRRIAQRTYWSVSIKDNEDDTTPTEIVGGNFLTDRLGTAVL